MKTITYKIVREDGEVLYEGHLPPGHIVHGKPERVSWNVPGLPEAKFGDRIVATQDYSGLPPKTEIASGEIQVDCNSRRLGVSPAHVAATEMADRAMADLREQTGDARSAYYTKGLTNWIPALAEAVLAQAKVVEAARAAVVAYDDKLGASWRNACEDLRASLEEMDAR
jgi:hypothetical protein